MSKQTYSTSVFYMPSFPPKICMGFLLQSNRKTDRKTRSKSSCEQIALDKVRTVLRTVLCNAGTPSNQEFILTFMECGCIHAANQLEA